MHVLITGGKGQLAHELAGIIDKGASEIGPIDPAYANAQVDLVDMEDFDISNWEATSAWFLSHKPYDLVINCAAMTNVDGCEAAPDAAFAANALGPQHLALAASAQGAKLVQVSTDYVFEGVDARPRTEEDVPHPISMYGRSKLAGEGLARALCPNTMVVRTAWLYGRVGKNFVKTMLKLADTHDSLGVVDDQLGNPTSAHDLAHAILVIAQAGEPGVYHATCEGTCSWADFAAAIMEEFGRACTIEYISSEEYKRRVPTAAPRPAYSSLENAHLARTVGNSMRPWRAALHAYAQSVDTREM